jgi:integrase
MGKRGNGEGSISRRKNGGWCAQYTVYTSEGRKRRTLYGKTRQEVATKLSKALADREGGFTFDAGATTVEEYLARWLSHSVRDTVSQKTYERYESIVRVHLSPALGRIRLKVLTPGHVRGLYREKLDAGLAPRTVLHVHRTLSKALKQATDDGLIPRNVRRVREAATTPQRGDAAALEGPGTNVPRYGERRPDGSPLRIGRHHRPAAGGAVGPQVGRRGPRRR